MVGRVSGVRGGADLPEERRQVQISNELEKSIDHTEEVAKRAEFAKFQPKTTGFSLKVPKELAQKMKGVIQDYFRG